MARYRGVRPKGNGIQIIYQLDGKRHWQLIDQAPTDRNLADAARLRQRLIESARLVGSEAEPAAPATQSFEECCRLFLAEKASTLKPSTIDGYRSKLEFYWSPLAAMDIRAIKLTDLKTLDRAVEWKSQKTRKDAHSVLRGVFAWAIAEELTDDNPATRLRSGAWQRPEIDAFTDEERRKIMAELDGTARVFYGLMFEVGARTGELMGLRWADVGADTLRIERSVYRGEDGSTKTHQGRSVLLTRAAQELLKNHTSSRFAGKHVFLTQYGEPYSIDRGLTFAFKLACTRAGVRYRRPYYCRHSFATRALMAGCQPSWVAAQLGDRLETVLRHYARWISGDRDRAELAKFEL
jgi:integrase